LLELTRRLLSRLPKPKANARALAFFYPATMSAFGVGVAVASMVAPCYCRSMAKKIGLGVVFAWFMIGGIGHFLFSESFARAVPPYVPYPLQMVYFTGVCEILGAIGVLIQRTRSAAGWSLVALTVAVTPVNVHMWLHPELFPNISHAVLTARLPIQVLLLACIVWSTRPDRHRSNRRGTRIRGGIKLDRKHLRRK
jgi:uncharacterized membrane protein